MRFLYTMSEVHPDAASLKPAGRLKISYDQGWIISF